MKKDFFAEFYSARQKKRMKDVIIGVILSKAILKGLLPSTQSFLQGNSTYFKGYMRTHLR